MRDTVTTVKGKCDATSTKAPRFGTPSLDLARTAATICLRSSSVTFFLELPLMGGLDGLLLMLEPRGLLRRLRLILEE